jgi:hypothetical protein
MLRQEQFAAASFVFLDLFKNGCIDHSSPEFIQLIKHFINNCLQVILGNQNIPADNIQYYQFPQFSGLILYLDNLL